MVEDVDIASVVDTWLVVVLALVALFGIITPFLLWAKYPPLGATHCLPGD